MESDGARIKIDSLFSFVDKILIIMLHSCPCEFMLSHMLPQSGSILNSDVVS